MISEILRIWNPASPNYCRINFAQDAADWGPSVNDYLFRLLTVYGDILLSSNLNYGECSVSLRNQCPPEYLANPMRLKPVLSEHADAILDST